MASSPLSSNAPITSASTLPVEGNKTTQSVLNKVEPVKMEQSACCKAPDMKAPVKSEMSLTQAGGTLAKHGGFFGAGMAPFASAAAGHTAYQLYSVISNVLSCQDENYSFAKDSMTSAASAVKVGGTLVAVGAMTAYPIGRFVIAPAAQNLWSALPDEPKEAASVLAKAGYNTSGQVVSKVGEISANAFNKAVDFAKTAHISIPEALVKTGMVAGSLTDTGSDAIVKTQNVYNNDVRLQAAQSRNADVKPA